MDKQITNYDEDYDEKYDEEILEMLRDFKKGHEEYLKSSSNIHQQTKSNDKNFKMYITTCLDHE